MTTVAVYPPATYDDAGDNVFPQRQGIVVLFTATADKTVANTTTQTTLYGTGVGSLTLPANFLTVGRSLRVKLVGYVEDTLSPTMQVRLKLGSSVVADSGATTITGSGTRIFQCEGTLTCRSTGASGTVIGQIWWLSEDAFSDGWSTTSATTTIDTTATQALDVTLEWGTANAANTCTITNATVEAFG